MEEAVTRRCGGSVRKGKEGRGGSKGEGVTRKDRAVDNGELSFISRARAHSRAGREEMIDGEHELPLTGQSEIMGLSRSSLYYKAVLESVRAKELMRQIDEIRLNTPFPGPGESGMNCVA